MFERMVGAAVKELPVTEHLLQEVISAGVKALKTNTYCEFKTADMAVRVLSGERGPVLQIPGHSTIYQHPLGLRLQSVDGTKLVVYKDHINGSFSDGTKVRQEGQQMYARLANGFSVRQEKLADDQLSISVGLPRSKEQVFLAAGEKYDLGEGAYAHHIGADQTAVVLPDGSSIRNSNWGFDFRHPIGGIGDGAQHADISILNNYLTKPEPVLQLHDRRIDSMYRSMFANGSSAKGMQVRVGGTWTELTQLTR